MEHHGSGKSSHGRCDAIDQKSAVVVGAIVACDPAGEKLSKVDEKAYEVVLDRIPTPKQVSKAAPAGTGEGPDHFALVSRKEGVVSLQEAYKPNCRILTGRFAC